MPLVAPSVYLVTATTDAWCLASSCHVTGKADFQDRWPKLKFQAKPGAANTVVSCSFPEVERREEKKTEEEQKRKEKTEEDTRKVSHKKIE